MKTGARSYLAVQAGFDVPLIMGSASTDVRGRFGGHEGRRLRSGDVLRVRPAPLLPIPSLPPEAFDSLYDRGPIRVTRGAQQDWFDTGAFEKLFSCAYTVSNQSDRAGLRLKGEALRPHEPRQLLTDGIPLGAIQVPQDGQPIILFVDQQTTGGYPKIANVITADMHRVGQLRPREEVRFAEVSMAEAIQALRKQERRLKEISP
jgi:antagonist of KipI